MSNFSIFEEIESIDSRNEMTTRLVNLFSSLDTKDAQIYTYLLQGRVAPLFVDKEFGFSEKSAIKALNNIVGRLDLQLDVKNLREKLGDAGLVAQEIMKSKGYISSKLNIQEVYEEFWRMIEVQGANSVKYKSEIFINLVMKSSPVDAKFITRIVSGKLRLGSSDKTLLDAFSFILAGDKSARKVLDYAYGVVSDLGFIANIVCGSEDGLNILGNIKPIAGIPIFPRLVERVASFEKAIERFPDGGIVQPKFDGLRCQIHKGVESNKIYENTIWQQYLRKGEEGGLFDSMGGVDKVKLFSRNLNDITNMFPEIVEEIGKLDCDSFIIDGEIIGWDKTEEIFRSFQETMTRKRKYGVDTKSGAVPVKYFAFDLMYKDGKNLLESDLADRLANLKGIDTKSCAVVEKADNIEIKGSAKMLSEVFDKYVEEKLEGIIIKKREGGYLPGVRNFDWIKIKKSIESKVVDTIDTVVLGYYYGSGRKVGFGMGSLLVGVYNPEKERFESVGKVGTGIKDKDWTKIRERLEKIELKEKSENIVSGLEPDVWVHPEVVITVEADEITKSSVHTACSSELSHGLSLRFPRLIYFDRDKLPEDATSVSELVEMWKISKGF
jgi:DNA ligase 1